MATRKELEEALLAAHKSGNVEDAKRIADSLVNFKETPNIDETRAQFEALPWYAKAGRAADDTARMIANGATLGWADNIAGNMPGGEGTDAEKAKSMEARQRGGSASMAAEILGMLLPSSRVSQGVGSALNIGGRTVGESAFREGIAGSILGAGSALSDTSDLSDIAGSAGLGAVGGAVGGVAGSKLGDLANWAGKKLGFNPGALVDDVTPPRTADELKRATDSAYDVVDSLGTRYDPNDFARQIANMDRDLNAARINPKLHPNATAMMDDLRNIPNSGPIPPRSIDEIRQIINRDVTGSRGEGHMAGIMAGNIDDFIENGLTTTGSSATSNKGVDAALKQARDLNRRMRTLQDVDQAMFKGENAAGDRGDIVALRALLNNPRRTKGMSGAELDALAKVVRGDGIEKFLRGTVGGIPVTPIGAGIITGAATGNPALGLLAGGGTALVEPLAERAARNYTDRNIKLLMESIAGGSTVPSAARSVLPPLGTATGVTMTEQDRESTRNRRKKRKRYGR